MLAPLLACTHRCRRLLLPPLSKVYFPMCGWGFTIMPDHAAVGAAPGAPLRGVRAWGHPKQLQSFVIPTQTSASPQILLPCLTEAGRHDHEVHSMVCRYKPGKLVEASAISLRQQTPFNQQTPDSLPFF